MLLSQISEIKDGRVITQDATNHLGEKEYQTYNAWREACKRINPNAQFEGDKDICQAKPGIGEWGGDKGVIYTKDCKTGDASSEEIEREYKRLKAMSPAEVVQEAQKYTRLDASHMKSESKGTLINYILNGEFNRKDLDAWGTKDCSSTKDSRSDDIQRMIEKLEDSLDSISSGPRVAEIKAKIQELEAEKNKLETGDCTEDSILTDILGNVSDFLAQVMGSGKAKDCKAEDGASFNGYADVVQDKNIETLVNLFSSDKEIKDHEVFHTLAAQLGIENPSDLEEMAYAMLQSYFSKGKYMTQGGDKPIDPKELAMGDKVEREHTDNPVFARKIALDHLSEIPDYYTRLAQMEKGAKTTDGGVGSGQKGHKTYRQKLMEKLKSAKPESKAAAKRREYMEQLSERMKSRSKEIKKEKEQEKARNEKYGKEESERQEKAGIGKSKFAKHEEIEKIAGVKLGRRLNDTPGIGRESEGLSVAKAEEGYNNLVSALKKDTEWNYSGDKKTSHKDGEDQKGITFQSKKTGESIRIENNSFGGDNYLSVDLGMNYLKRW